MARKEKRHTQKRRWTNKNGEEEENEKNVWK